MIERPVSITFGEMREMGVRGVALVFPMPFAGLLKACRFVFMAERYPPCVGK
jgi:hypothetical protein